MANSKWKCTCCGQYYDKDQQRITTPRGSFAGYDHVQEFVKHENAKQLFRQKSKAIKDKKAKHRADKERIKTRAQWLKEAQAAVNKYVRLRDRGKPCISCDKPDNGQHQRHASHYKSVGSNSALRFNLLNIHASCSTCNNHLSGNIGEYIPRLIAKISQDKYDWLLTQNQAVKHNEDYLKRLKKIFNKRARLKEKAFIKGEL